MGQIKGLTYAEMKRNRLPGSSRDLLLVSELETVADLEAYQTHPLHVPVAIEVLKTAACDLVCFVYEM